MKPCLLVLMKQHSLIPRRCWIKRCLPVAQVTGVAEIQENILVIYKAVFETAPEVTIRLSISAAEPHQVTGLWFDSPSCGNNHQNSMQRKTGGNYPARLVYSRSLASSHQTSISSRDICRSGLAGLAGALLNIGKTVAEPLISSPQCASSASTPVPANQVDSRQIKVPSSFSCSTDHQPCPPPPVPPGFFGGQAQYPASQIPPGLPAPEFPCLGEGNATGTPSSIPFPARH